MYSLKIIVPYRDNAIKNAIINPRETVSFLKSPKIHTHENIYIYSRLIFEMRQGTQPWRAAKGIDGYKR